MRCRVVILLFLFILSILPCFSSEVLPKTDDNTQNKTNIFIYHIPDEDEDEISENKKHTDDEKNIDITTDDVTADTSGLIDIFDQSMDYEIGDMYNAVLQGYAQYNEIDENQDAIKLDDFNVLTLNIKQPSHVGAARYTLLRPTNSLFTDKNIYSKYSGSEYSIAPIVTKNSRSFFDGAGGNFSAGALYNQIIDTGELEQSSGVFSKYKYKRFSVTTSYLKTVNSTNNTYNDNFYITPELELNQYFSLKQNFSADTVKRRKKAEIILSINPLGNKDIDRLRFELGASQTYDDDNNLFKSQFRFSTNFRL